MTEKVYITHVSGEMDGEKFDSILGVFKNQSDAKQALINDVEDLQNNWTHIDFTDPGDWEGGWSEDGLSYDGFTPCDDYNYGGCVEEYEIK